MAESSDRRRGFLPSLAALLIGLPALYVLSTGPVMRLVMWQMGGGRLDLETADRLLSAVYAPLLWLTERAEPVGRFRPVVHRTLAGVTTLTNERSHAIYLNAPNPDRQGVGTPTRPPPPDRPGADAAGSAGDGKPEPRHPSPMARPTMTDPADRDRRGKFLPAAAALLALPLLYVLSLGPAVKLTEAGLIAGPVEGWLTRFYVPLAWLHERYSPAQAALDWYLMLWSAGP